MPTSPPSASLTFLRAVVYRYASCGRYPEAMTIPSSSQPPSWPPCQPPTYNPEALEAGNPQHTRPLAGPPRSPTGGRFRLLTAGSAGALDRCHQPPPPASA
jgi:hypothetical protein